MPYLTVNKPPEFHEITFDDILNGFDESLLKPVRDMSNTRTFFKEQISDMLEARMPYGEAAAALQDFCEKYKNIIEAEDKSVFYRSFKIPKRNGKLREINAPNNEINKAIRDFMKICENLLYFNHHNTAFAYVKGRCFLDAVKKHQANKSRWILKTDLSGFFPNTTQDFLFKMLSQVFPVSTFIADEHNKELFQKALSVCFLNGGLPQGSPASPMLTNAMMIPIDYTISKYCHEHSPHLCYTRYADDMDFSSEFSFTWTKVVNDVNAIFESFGAPFRFNSEKTHYGSTSGRNWMLGVMLNKDNNITIGHEKKKNFKTMLFCFGNSCKEGKWWSVEDTQHLQGLIAYYTNVEGDVITEIIKGYNKKFGFDLREKIKLIISGKLA